MQHPFNLCPSILGKNKSITFIKLTSYVCPSYIFSIKSPARFDFKKLDNINGKHINSSNDLELIEDINKFNDVCEENNLNDLKQEFNNRLDRIEEKLK